MEKVLVTGGTGYIGNFLVSHLLSLGKKVLVLDKSIRQPTYCDIHKAEFIEGDMLSHELLHHCLEQVDTCFHLASLSSVSICARDWIFSHENNVLSFNCLLEELRKISHPVKLIYASSAAVYGDSKILPLVESEHIIPSSTFAADKLSNEIYAEVMDRVHGIRSIGLRLFNVYGPGQFKANSHNGVINSFKSAIEANQPLTIFGDGMQTRDFIYIKDVVEAFMAAVTTPAEKSGIFNVCSGQAISISKLAELMLQLSTAKLPVVYENAREVDVYHSVGDNKLTKKELNFTAKTPIEVGLDWFLKERGIP
jgi:UDP-glucose 4-epimerase